MRAGILATGMIALLAVSGCHRTAGGEAALTPQKRAEIRKAEIATAERKREEAIPLRYRQQADNVAMTDLIRNRLGAPASTDHGQGMIARTGSTVDAYRDQAAYAHDDYQSIHRRRLSERDMETVAARPTMYKGHHVSYGPDGKPNID